MAFFKFRWPGKQEQQPSDNGRTGRRGRSPQPPSIEEMRRRARHRLIGAAVLVAAAVVGFPLIFDTQPRPIPVDVAIDIPDRHKVAPLVVPQDAVDAPAAPRTLPVTEAALDAGEELVAAHSPAASPAPAPAPAPPALPALVPPPGFAPAAPAAPTAPTQAAEPASTPAPTRPEPAARPEAPQDVKTEARTETRHEARPEPKPTPKPEPKPEPKARPIDEAARARALLEGRTPVAVAAAPASAPRPEPQPGEAGRFIVQVGAFADADKAREVREKLERSGMKAHTQLVQTKEGPRTRVRVGPFASRAEADRAAERVRGSGLSGAVLAL